MNNMIPIKIFREVFAGTPAVLTKIGSDLHQKALEVSKQGKPLALIYFRATGRVMLMKVNPNLIN